jgi:hypothetical protein
MDRVKQLDEYEKAAAGIPADNNYYRGFINGNSSVNPTNSQQVSLQLHTLVLDIRKKLKIGDKDLIAVLPNEKRTEPAEVTNRRVDIDIARLVLQERQENPNISEPDLQTKVAARMQLSLNNLEYDQTQGLVRKYNVKLGIIPATLSPNTAIATGVGFVASPHELALESPIAEKQGDELISNDISSTFGKLGASKKVQIGLSGVPLGRIPLPADNKEQVAAKAQALMAVADKLIPENPSAQDILAFRMAVSTAAFVNKNTWQDELTQAYRSARAQMTTDNVKVEIRDRTPSLVMRNGAGRVLAELPVTENAMGDNLTKSPYFINKVQKMSEDDLRKKYKETFSAASQRDADLLMATWMQRQEQGLEYVIPGEPTEPDGMFIRAKRPEYIYAYRWNGSKESPKAQIIKTPMRLTLDQNDNPVYMICTPDKFSKEFQEQVIYQKPTN